MNTVFFYFLNTVASFLLEDINSENHSLESM